jgi:AraC-like DNA-binding protein
MKNIIELPEHFVKDSDLNMIRLEGLSFVKYSSYTKSFRNNIHVNKCMFVAVLEGEKVLHTADGYVTIKKGEAFLAGKGTYLTSEITSSTKSAFKSLVFFFDDELLSRFMIEKVGKKQNVNDKICSSGILPINISSMLSACIDSTLLYFAHKVPHVKDIMRLKFEEVLFNIYYSEKRDNFISFVSHALKDNSQKLEQIMFSNLTEPFTLNDFASLAGKSLSTFKKDFKIHFGMPPKTWINKERLKLAKFMLENSENNVTEICMDIGFQSISHFIQVFKKTYGTTPKQIQKNHNRHFSDQN